MHIRFKAKLPVRMVELGAGDGHLLLNVAHRLGPRSGRPELIFVDRQPCVDRPTRRAFQDLGYRVQVVRAEALQWLSQPRTDRFDLVIANLFLHHFTDTDLQKLLAETARWSDGMIACEPARSYLSWLASYCLAVIGCNDITRHDAPLSVQAGFRDREISRLWPATREWELGETSVGLFSRGFSARRHKNLDAT